MCDTVTDRFLINFLEVETVEATQCNSCNQHHDGVYQDTLALAPTPVGQSVGQWVMFSDFGDSYRIYRACLSNNNS